MQKKTKKQHNNDLLLEFNVQCMSKQMEISVLKYESSNNSLFSHLVRVLITSYTTCCTKEHLTMETEQVFILLWSRGDLDDGDGEAVGGRGKDSWS